MINCGYVLGIVHASEVNAKALTYYLLSFLNNKGISLHKTLVFDNTMPGEKSGVQKRMRCVFLIPSILIVTDINSN